jgi:hypothetical protein
MLKGSAGCCRVPEAAEVRQGSCRVADAGNLRRLETREFLLEDLLAVGVLISPQVAKHKEFLQSATNS